MIEREQPSFARDFFGTTSLSFLYDNHPELISSLISAVDGIVQTGTCFYCFCASYLRV